MERTTEVELKPCRNRERERSMAASDLTWRRLDAIESERLLELDILVSWIRFVGGGEGGGYQRLRRRFWDEDSKGP